MCGDPCRATRVALHLSQQISSEPWGLSGVAEVSRYPPPPSQEGPVAPVALQLPRVSHVKLPLKMCRATAGCSSYTCGCRPTLCNYGRNLNMKALKDRREPREFRGFARGWFSKGWLCGCYPGTKTGTRVHSHVPPERKLERGYVRMFPPERKAGTRVHSPKPPFYETTLCFLSRI